MIVLIDYQAGNLTSVKNALRHLGASFTVASSPEEVARGDKVIFPGVGQAGQAMDSLADRGLDQALREFAAGGKPLLGICLGLQILLEHSQERDTPLLGLIPGRVTRFPPSGEYKIPQIGWNTVKHNGSLLFDGIPQDSSFYFVHSYYREAPGLAPPVIASAQYGCTFAAAIRKENLWATQFHPEKSGPWGLLLLKNFLEKIH